ncbi:prepilin-type N-terminal cleavage/methylation domain-containing protein [Desulfobacter curvatus]|uniref:prepilin-type N-terminal cleavage/methylation domain-containing protein n=1 Tax=Desulfobacter curvatus TaxID=2290 RepID=UPI000377954D|nr:prepilin-type N-terminal cleavage/methylation domain-containing protein [Desulfobacter curvatus]
MSLLFKLRTQICLVNSHIKKGGFTLIELMIVVAIIGTLAAIATPIYLNLKDKVRVTIAISDIKAIEKNILVYYVEFDVFPPDLAAIGMANLTDPWGNPYRYLPVAGTPSGQLRKDHFMVPVNSDYDLYSMGPDGRSTGPFTAEASRDDIVRANDGGFVGLVSNY